MRGQLNWTTTFYKLWLNQKKQTKLYFLSGSVITKLSTWFCAEISFCRSYCHECISKKPLWKFLWTTAALQWNSGLLNGLAGNLGVSVSTEVFSRQWYYGGEELGLRHLFQQYSHLVSCSPAFLSRFFHFSKSPHLLTAVGNGNSDDRNQPYGTSR